jgi:hypothetical protein
MIAPNSLLSSAYINIIKYLKAKLKSSEDKFVLV